MYGLCTDIILPYSLHLGTNNDIISSMSPENRELIKTPLMGKIEKEFGKDGQLIEDLLRQEYCEKQQGAAVVAALFGVSYATILGWVKRCNIPVHRVGTTEELWLDSKFRESKIKGLQRGWQNLDTEEKQVRVSKIHNETWYQSAANSWDKLSPEEKMLRIKKTIEGRKKTYEAKIIALLEGDPEQVLKGLIKQGLSVAEIAAQVDKKPKTIYSWLKKAGIHKNGRITLKHKTVEHRQAVINRAEEAGLMKYLLPNDRLVLYRRYNDNKSLEEIGGELTLKKQRVAQIEIRALIVLEKMLAGERISSKSVASFPEGLKFRSI